MFRHVAVAWMAMRECLLPSMRRQEVQEEVMADLHSCLEQLEVRIEEMEAKIQRCEEQATFHMRLAEKRQNRATPVAVVQRERQRAKMYMQDRHRLQKELDRTTSLRVALRAQIDNIAASQVDTIIIDAMRGFNSNISRMSLPERAREVEGLWEALSERQSEVANLQDVMASVSSAMMTPMQHADDEYDHSASDESLWRELESLMLSTPEEAVIPANNNLKPAEEAVSHRQEPQAEEDAPQTAAAVMLMASPSSS